MERSAVKIYEYPNQDYHFYGIMGPYFAHRGYAKEMGGWQFYNEPGSIWFLVFTDELAGFCAAFPRNTHIFWDNCFVLKQWRGKGLSRLLIDARLDYSHQFNKEIRTITDNSIQMRNYERIGMQKNGNRGRYTKFILRPSSENQTSGVGAITHAQTQPMEPEQGR